MLDIPGRNDAKLCNIDFCIYDTHRLHQCYTRVSKMLDTLGKNVGYTSEKCWIYLREIMQNDVTFSKMLHAQKKMLPS